MDPSSNLCSLSHSSFDYPTFLYPLWYTPSSSPNLTTETIPISTTGNPPPYCVDETRYNTLQKLKNSFDNPNFDKARDASNPFEKIGRSIFMNRAAIKLANIDSVLHVTPSASTYQKQQLDDDLTFCDIAAGPGGFTQYLQYRYPKSIGYGMTLKSQTLDWNTSLLDMNRFTPFYGDDNSGNLYTQWRSFVDFVKSKNPSGVDLITADGGFDLESSESSNEKNELLQKQEFLSSRLFLVQALVALSCVKTGGNVLIKTFDTVTEFSAQIIYLLSCCFDKVMLFKPVTSRPANAEKYFVGRGAKRYIQQYIAVLEKAASKFTDTTYSEILFTEELPEDFLKWITEQNNNSTNLQIKTAASILNYLNGKEIQQEKYDIHKFLIIWNLPETPNNPKRSAFKF